MRAILHTDVVVLGRCLLAVGYERRVRLCDEIFDMAHAADKYRKRYGIYHQYYGSGSLASACKDLPKRPEPFLSDQDYAHCMKTIFERVLGGALSI